METSNDRALCRVVGPPRRFRLRDAVGGCRPAASRSNAGDSESIGSTFAPLSSWPRRRPVWRQLPVPLLSQSLACTARIGRCRRRCRSDRQSRAARVGRRPRFERFQSPYLPSAQTGLSRIRLTSVRGSGASARSRLASLIAKSPIGRDFGLADWRSNTVSRLNHLTLITSTNWLLQTGAAQGGRP